MSPGGTMLRVYAGLKARVTAGEFAPGERLDPKRLAGDMLASTTPVRDALHRLHGERLVESFAQEGFRAIQIVEPAIRDLYEWSNELLHVVLAAVSRQSLAATRDTAAPPDDYAQRVADCFLGLAYRSPNHEHRYAVANLLDRSALYRPVEVLVFPQAVDDVAAIERALIGGDMAAAQAALDHFHHRRFAMVSAIAAHLRPRSAS